MSVYSNRLPQQFQTPHSLEHGPDYDFYSTFSFPVLLFATIVTVAQICVWTLITLAAGVFTPLDTFVIYTPYTLSMSFASCVLLSFVFSKFEPRSQKKRGLFLVLYFLVYFSMLQVGIVTGFMAMLFGIDMWLRLGYLVVYVGLSCWQAQQVKQRLNNSHEGIWHDE